MVGYHAKVFPVPLVEQLGAGHEGWGNGVFFFGGI
jgi:hypothetical protein